MVNMHRSNVRFLDLPNEILLIILKKLPNMDVLCSLIGVDNKRLDQIVQDQTFTQTLDFVLTTPPYDIISLPEPILDRFCIHILPKIHQNVKSLAVDSSSIERILLVGDYLNLTELKIFNFNDELVSNYFTDQSSFRCVFRQQITHLVVAYKTPIEISLDKRYLRKVHHYLFEFFNNLKHFSVTGSPILLTLHNSSEATFSSSTLSKLCVYVSKFQDILALLDGRLKHLTSFTVLTDDRSYESSAVYNMNDLPGLKYFSLRCFCSNNEYDTHVLPLLRRMSNLEELTLKIDKRSRTSCVDGTEINNEILIHMPLLHKFDFYIRTETDRRHATHTVSIDEIQQSFRNIGYPDVGCIVTECYGTVTYDVFSVPFVFDELSLISSTFPSIIFARVTWLRLRARVPFEYEFFVRIACFFPSVKELYIMNTKPQSRLLMKSNSDDNQQNSVVEFPYLVSLCFHLAHMDYVELFLNETRTRLPRLNKLMISYENLAVVTENFTRETTRKNCARVKQLELDASLAFSKELHEYFPLL